MPSRIRAVRWACVIAGVILAGLALPGTAALADGDPASDVLLAENVFYPYNPPVLPSLEKALNGEAAAAARAHFHLKVAIIDSPYDLGVVPEMLGHPETYAKFLDQELKLFLGPHPPLLVVMPGGYGMAGLPAPARRAAAALAKPTGSSSNDLVRAAIAAVPKLAAAAGHPIAGVGGGSAGGAGGGGGVWTVTIVALVAAALAAAVLLVRRRLDRSV